MRSSVVFVVLVLGALAARVDALTLPDGFTLRHTWPVSGQGGLGFQAGTRPGGLLFSADGTTLYVVSTADDADQSALWRVGVTRDAAMRVTGVVGPPTRVFDGNVNTPGLDGGLAFGPGGNLFYCYFEANVLGERQVVSGSIQATEQAYDVFAVGVPTSILGIAFSPVRTDPGTGFGRMQISRGLGNQLYELGLGADPGAAGFWKPATPLVLLARLFRDDVAGIAYVPAGTFAGDLLYAATGWGELRLVMIDGATGLPVDADTGTPTLGTTHPVDALLAAGLDDGVTGGPVGLTFDPLPTGDVFVATFDGNPANAILQIGGFDTAGPTTSTTTTTTATTTSTTGPSTTTTTAPPGSTTTTSPASTTTTSTTTTSTVTSPLPTSTTVVETGTTTTTLPAGCGIGVSFPAVSCRLRELGSAVVAAGDLNGLAAGLQRRVVRGAARLAVAESRAGLGRRRAARSALAAAGHELREFRARLATARGRKLPDGVRSALDGAARGLVRDVRALGRAL